MLKVSAVSGRGRPEDWRFESQEVGEGHGFIAGRRLDRRETLTIFGHAHHYGYAEMWSAWRPGRRSAPAAADCTGCKSMLDSGGHCRRTSADLRQLPISEWAAAALRRNAASSSSADQRSFVGMAPRDPTSTCSSAVGSSRRGPASRRHADHISA